MKQLFLVPGTVKEYGSDGDGDPDIRLVEAETAEDAVEDFFYAVDAEGYFIVGRAIAKPVIRR